MTDEADPDCLIWKFQSPDSTVWLGWSAHMKLRTWKSSTRGVHMLAWKMSDQARIMTQIHFQVNRLYSQGENEKGGNKIYDGTVKRSERSRMETLRVWKGLRRLWTHRRSEVLSSCYLMKCVCFQKQQTCCSGIHTYVWSRPRAESSGVPHGQFTCTCCSLPVAFAIKKKNTIMTAMSTVNRFWLMAIREES